jgi:hypothetical protein
VGDLRDVINVQGSQWNQPDSGSFTINLGKFSDAVHRILVGAEPPRVVAELRCPVRSRLGRFIPAPGETTDADPCRRTDRWWDFGLTTDPFRLSRDVTEAILAYGFPFFAQLDSLGAMQASLAQARVQRSLPFPQNVQIAIIDDLLGEHEVAALQLNALYASFASKGYTAAEQISIRVAERLHIELPAPR